MTTYGDGEGPGPDLKEAKKAAKAEREKHRATPDDPRDTGTDTDLEDPAKQEKDT